MNTFCLGIKIKDRWRLRDENLRISYIDKDNFIITTPRDVNDKH